MSIYHVNVRGIRSKIKSLKKIIEEKKPMLIGIVETHLDKSEDISTEIFHYYVVTKRRMKQCKRSDVWGG